MRCSSCPDRPRSVTIVICGVFILGLLNAWRAAAIAQQLALLQAVNVQLDPRIRLILALVWAFLFMGTAGALWWRQPWTQLLLPLLLLFHALYRLGLLAFFVQSPAARAGWPASAVVYSILIILAYWTLNRAAGQTYFHQLERRE